MWMPLYLPNLARAYAELGQFDDAWRCIGEAMTAIEATRETWCEAEVNRIAGEITLLSPKPNATKAEAYFERALAVAHEQQTKSWELRCGAIRANDSKPAIFSPRSTTGSPKASIRLICNRPRLCWAN